MQIPNAANVAGAVAQRHGELERRLLEVSTEGLAAPSRLPGWSRLTIACHLRFGAETTYAMTVAALSGKDAAYYPEGREQQRHSTLTTRDGEDASDVVHSLIDASNELDSLWRTLDIDHWALPVREPADNADLGSVTLGMLALLRLTEVEVHGIDLDIECSSWSEVFVDNALRMRIRRLATRRSNHQLVDRTLHGKWVLRPTDGTPFSISTGAEGVVIAEGHAVDGDAELAGSKRNLLALLLGRLDVSQLSVSGDQQLAESFSRAFPGP